MNDLQYIDLSVDYIARDGGFWFASLQVGASVNNAPADSKALATLQAWSSYTDQQVTLAAMYAHIAGLAKAKGVAIQPWPSRLV